MKFFSIITLALFFSCFAYAEQKVVCEDGVCYIVSDDKAEKTDNTAEKSVPEKVFVPVRKSVGMTDTPEFMAFLKDEPVADPLAGATFWGMILLALIGGFALNLTPCVLPMLPVNLAVIGASGGGKTGFIRGLLYGTGIAVAYGILGILAAFAGMSFGTLNSSPLFNFAIAVIFVVLSISMAGVFDIDLASRFRMNPGKLKFSKDMLALFMGAISAILAGACVAPVVISVLLFAARIGWYGCFVPLALGVGMALPWPIVGAGLSILPKPGKFMVALKYVFAVIIFAAGVYYAYTGIKLMNAGSSSENTDGITALEKAKAESLESGKPVLVRFTASWCKNCHAMERTTLQDAGVKKYIDDNFIMVTFPAEDPTRPEIKAILEEYEIPGFPAFVILQSSDRQQK